MPAFDFSCAPFRVRESTTPEDVAEQIAACYEVVSAFPDKMACATEAAFRVTGLPTDAPLATAARALAQDIDAGVGDGRANPYHNSQHYCEVLLAALYLAQRALLTQTEQAQLLVAALAHDFHHDGRSSIGNAFRLELLAAQATTPYLNEAGVAQEEQARIVSLILSTETTVGVPYARRCHEYFFAGAPKPPVRDIVTGLAVLVEDARLARQAVLLGEADLLPSVGLTVYYGEMTQANLAKEWGRPLSAVDKIFFLEKIFGDFLVSRFFSPNVQFMKDAMRRKAEAIQR
ncbi:MAG: hypothetical protein ABL891_17885 [Burkholderiales bacterium]